MVVEPADPRKRTNRLPAADETSGEETTRSTTLSLFMSAAHSPVPNRPPLSIVPVNPAVELEDTLMCDAMVAEPVDPRKRTYTAPVVVPPSPSLKEPATMSMMLSPFMSTPCMAPFPSWSLSLSAVVNAPVTLACDAIVLAPDDPRNKISNAPRLPLSGSSMLVRMSTTPSLFMSTQWTAFPNCSAESENVLVNPPRFLETK
mmetsp:Transcript_10990/g.23268  ORF Transcript_10990/g.23268 Transcript_10990/m.23268 type:complete len:202 (-) Transcript_10990:135-740(-)